MGNEKNQIQQWESYRQPWDETVHTVKERDFSSIVESCSIVAFACFSAFELHLPHFSKFPGYKCSHFQSMQRNNLLDIAMIVKAILILSLLSPKIYFAFTFYDKKHIPLPLESLQPTSLALSYSLFLLFSFICNPQLSGSFNFTQQTMIHFPPRQNYFSCPSLTK